MESSRERPYLWLIENSNEEQGLRLDIQSLMEEKHVSIGYIHPNGKLEQIFPPRILSFPMSLDRLKYLKDRLEHVKRAYPQVVHISEELSRPPRLKLIR